MTAAAERKSADPPSFAKFDPPTGHLIWLLAVRWRSTLGRELAEFGLTHAQYVLLGSLSRLAAVTGTAPNQRQLAEFSGLEPMFVSRLARSLEDIGFLTRHEHPDDPRAWGLALTPAGRDALAPAVQAVQRFQERATAILGGPNSARAKRLRSDLLDLLDNTP